MRGVLLLAIVLLTTVGNFETQGCSSQQTTPSSDDIFSTADGVRFRVEVVVKGLEIPWSFAFAPDGRLFVTERPGRVRIVDISRGTSDVALTLDDVFAQGEAGVLGLALDPAFTANHLLYLYYTARTSASAANRVVRYRESSGRLTEPTVLFDGIPANTIHDGGRLRFGPDGLLYVTTGDAAGEDQAQDVASYAGKILRINTDGTTPRANPFSSPIYSYGHRNPQGLDWHPATGELWESEHGATGNDEINVIDAGANYGWPRIEGSATLPMMRPPIVFYNPALAPSGASFYRAQRLPQFTNNFFVATLRGTLLLRLQVNASTRQVTGQERLLEGQFGRIRDVATGPDGNLYFCTSNRDGRGTPTTDDDRIARIVPAS